MVAGWYAVRLAALTMERVAFSRLGRTGTPLTAAAVAYGGAALILGLVAGTTGPPWDWEAVPAGAVYAVSFLLYLWALQLGPLAVVAPWPAATALLLWLWHPTGGWGALAGVVLLVGGGLVSAGQSPGRGRQAVVVMLVSDAFLAWARLLDLGHGEGSPAAYAFTVFAVVTGLFWLATVASGRVAETWGIVRAQPGWAALAAASNGTAYLTVVMLLRYWPPYLLEALSAAAGILTAVVGVLWLHEGQAGRRLGGAALMGLGAGVLLLLRG